MTTAASDTPTALDGLKVVDFCRFMPGAYVTWMMADMGADVVRIEHPREIAKQTFVAGHAGETTEAAEYRRALFSHARNKRSILLNPGNAAAREVILELIKGADVLVEDYRPGVLAKMGYAYEDMIKLNPRLVYTSVTFAGQTGPYSNRAGHDPLALALSGALGRLVNQSTPMFPQVQIADVLTGSHATIATLMALEARHRTGRGQRVDVSMSDACMPLMLTTLGRNPDVDALGPPDGTWLPKGGLWECADGGWVCTTDMETQYWKRFCDVMGRPEYFALQHATDRFPEMKEDLKAIFKTKPRDEWMSIFAQADTQAMPVYSLAEAIRDPHNNARGMVVQAPYGKEGKTVTQVGTPFHLSETPGKVRHAATGAGAHSDEILAGLGYTKEKVDALRAAGGFDG